MLVGQLSLVEKYPQLFWLGVASLVLPLLLILYQFVEKRWGIRRVSADIQTTYDRYEIEYWEADRQFRSDLYEMEAAVLRANYDAITRLRTQMFLRLNGELIPLYTRMLRYRCKYVEDYSRDDIELPSRIGSDIATWREWIETLNSPFLLYVCDLERLCFTRSTFADLQRVSIKYLPRIAHNYIRENIAIAIYP